MRQTQHYLAGMTVATDFTPGKPLCISGCMIMICEYGHIEISINSHRFVIQKGNMSFIVFDMLAIPLDISPDFKAKIITMDFDASQDIFFLVNSNRFWEYVYSLPVFPVNADMLHVVRHWFDIIDWITSNCSDATCEKFLHNEMENFMLVMADTIENHLGVLGTNPPKNRAWLLVNEFLGLINRYYTSHHDVAFYASKLNISPNYLNIIAKRNIGVSAKSQISIQLGLVTKMLLDTTDLTIKEIANRLHYNDPSYLCRIFRKQFGLSPLEYRNTQKAASNNRYKNMPK